MASKQMKLLFYGQNHVRNDWFVDMEQATWQGFLAELAGDLDRYGIDLQVSIMPETVIAINSYGDLLNAVRIASPADGFAAVCIGHVIGKSQNLDLKEDIRRAVMRVAFAPETIAPDAEHRKVCHNCGCGC